MALKTRTTLAPQWWTPEEEKEAEKPTRFKLRPLTSPEIESVTPVGRAFGSKDYNGVLALGVVDVENLIDEITGAESKNLDELSLGVRAEIVAEIISISTMDAAAAKN